MKLIFGVIISLSFSSAAFAAKNEIFCTEYAKSIQAQYKGKAIGLSEISSIRAAAKSQNAKIEFLPLVIDRDPAPADFRSNRVVILIDANNVLLAASCN